METKIGTLIELSNIPHYTIKSDEFIPHPKYMQKPQSQTLQSNKFSL